MTNFHIRGGSGCLSQRCLLLLTPVRPHSEQKYHYTLTSRWSPPPSPAPSPPPSSLFTLIWVSHWHDNKPNFWFFRRLSLQMFPLGQSLGSVSNSLSSRKLVFYRKHLFFLRNTSKKNIRHLCRNGILSGPARVIWHTTWSLDVIVCRALCASLLVISQTRIYKAPLIHCPLHTCVVGILKRSYDKSGRKWVHPGGAVNPRLTPWPLLLVTSRRAACSFILINSIKAC